MGLYKEWTSLLNGQTKDTFEDFWKEYSEGETAIYKDILANKMNNVTGKVSDLAAKYGVREVIFMGFLDGIQTSINEPTDLDSVTSDTEISLDIDFEKLFFNMLKAESDYLFTLEEWDGIFSEEKRQEIATEYRRSRTVVKGKKIGRNDPCPCGSGKKYKHCCGKNA